MDCARRPGTRRCDLLCGGSAVLCMRVPRATSIAACCTLVSADVVACAQGVHRGTKRGVYRFSSKLAGLEGGFGVDGVFEGAGERFSQDDGVWGGGTGEVDGAIDEVYGGILEDFWGHGNFNQQDDATCQVRSEPHARGQGCADNGGMGLPTLGV